MSLIAFEGQLSVPRTFSFDELRRLPAQLTERSMLLGGRAIAGVRIGALIADLGVKPWARFAVVRAEDGYAANVPLALVVDCVLVYAVGDAPLPVELGGPIRFLARGADRCSNVKRVAAIGFREAAVEVAHHCPHAVARGAGNLVVLPGGQS
ncbi:MAG TPA: molybdopterin-dependent oxidoreductase [Polyangia bacterium]